MCPFPCAASPQRSMSRRAFCNAGAARDRQRIVICFQQRSLTTSPREPAHETEIPPRHSRFFKQARWIQTELVACRSGEAGEGRSAAGAKDEAAANCVEIRE